MKGYFACLLLFFVFLFCVAGSRSRSVQHNGEQKLIKKSLEYNNTLSLVANNSEDKDEGISENVTFKYLPSLQEMEMESNSPIMQNQTIDFNDIALKKLCDELKDENLKIEIFRIICKKHPRHENAGLTKQNVSENNETKIVYDKSRESSNEERHKEIYSVVSNDHENIVEGYQVKNKKNNDEEKNDSPNNKEVHKKVVKIDSGNNTQTLSVYDDYPIQDHEFKSNFSIILEEKELQSGKKEEGHGGVHGIVTEANKIQNGKKIEKQNHKSQDNNPNRVTDKSFLSSNNENNNTKITIKLDKDDKVNPKSDSNYTLISIKDKKLTTSNANEPQNAISHSQKKNNIAKHKLKIHTPNRNEETDKQSNTINSISNENLKKMVKHVASKLMNHNFSAKRDPAKENDKHSSSDEHKVKIKKISVQPELSPYYKEHRTPADKILKGSRLNKGTKISHPLASAKRTLERNKVNNNSKEIGKNLGNNDSNHKIKTSQILHDNEVDKIRKESVHEKEKEITIQGRGNIVTPLNKGTAQTKLLNDIQERNNNSEHEKEFNNHKNKTNEKKKNRDYFSNQINKNQGPETDSKQIFSSKIPSETIAFDEHNKKQEFIEINKEEKENKIKIISQNNETEKKDIEEQRDTKLRQHLRNSNVAYSTVLIGVCSTLIISTIFLTIIGVYYRKVNLERRRYYGHVLLNPEENIALFNQGTYNGDVDRYESWNSQIRI